jgi:hypothetical protein
VHNLPGEAVSAAFGFNVCRDWQARCSYRLKQEVTAMRTFNRCMLIAGVAGAMTCLIAQEKDRDQHDQGSVQEAIRFEKAKQAAADRQERIEEARAHQHQQKPSTARRTDTQSPRHGAADRAAGQKDAPR